MIYTAINDKPLAKVSYEELIGTFVETVFFQFMDRGRAGLTAGAVDFIDTASRWVKLRNDRAFPMSELIFSEISEKVKALLVDGFIKAGTEGLRDGLRSSYLVILDSVTPR